MVDQKVSEREFPVSMRNLFHQTTDSEIGVLAFPMNTFEFRADLVTTIDWCRSRFSIARPVESLRSKQLEPSIEIASTDDLAEIQGAVSQVVSRRASIAGRVDRSIERIGRLLSFEVRQSLFDGVSKFETMGFIDDTNAPPWDSWVCMIDELLISWVPPEMVDCVEAAITCNAEECISWLSNVHGHPLVAELSGKQLVW